MRDVVLYIAMSLDGCIADRTGGVGWLAGQDPDAELPDTYAAFIRGVDTVVMGRTTYRQVVTELSPDVWPYEGLDCYVVSHRPGPGAEGLRFTREPPAALVRRLRQQAGRDIWICGGASIVGPLVRENLIDRYHLAVIPTLLGGGTRLFPAGGPALPLRLTGSRHYNGITELIYERR